MKPLDLVIYPPAPPEPEDNISLEWFAWHGDRSREQMLCEWKRLTDAELAAEFWFMEAVMAAQMARAASGYVDPRDVLEARADFEVVERFAMLPHYDEEEL